MSRRPAILAIARWEWARRKRAIIVLGVLGGLFGGIVVAGVALTRRTVTAPTRLLEAVDPGDVHVRVFGPLLDQVVALPSVETYYAGGISVGRLEGRDALNYFGIVAPTSTTSLVRPVIVSGRSADPNAADEVTLTEAVSRSSGIRAGDHVSVAMLTAEEVQQFDTGFGEPDGPLLDLIVTGVVRVPPGLFEGTPVIATPAFAAAHGDLFVGDDVYIGLRGGAGSIAEFRRDADRVAAATAAEMGIQDFPPLGIDETRAGTDTLLASSHVLFGGLIAALVIGALAVVAALGQAWSRHHDSEAATQRVESELGLPTSARVVARMIPAAATALLGGLVAAAVATTASGLEPVGSLQRVEPHAGWRFDAVVVGVGAAVVAFVVALVAAVTAWRAGRTIDASSTAAHRRRLAAVPRRNGWPLAGATFALSPGGGRRHVPVRMSLVGGVLGVAGIVGSATFAASLDRLASTPTRYGWTADFLIADVNDGIVGRLIDDTRLDGVVNLYSGQVGIAGRQVAGFSIEPVRVARGRGPVGWVMLSGRAPRADDEIAIGPKLARRAGIRIGDRVDVGSATTLRVVGLGLEPTANGEELGTSALMTTTTLRAVSVASPFREALVRVDPGADTDVVIASYAEFELTPESQPGAVRNVTDLGHLPLILGAFLAALAAVALGHALVVTTRLRSGDIAVLRAIGASPRQAGLAVVTMAVATTAVGFVFGVPLGYALGRLVWGEVAESIAVRGDVAISSAALVSLAAVFVVAVIIALAPARRASRLDPGQELRST